MSSFSSTPTLPPPDSHPTGVGGAAGHHPGRGHCGHEAPQAGSIRAGRRRDRATQLQQARLRHHQHVQKLPCMVSAR